MSMKVYSSLCVAVTLLSCYVCNGRDIPNLKSVLALEGSDFGVDQLFRSKGGATTVTSLTSDDSGSELDVASSEISSIFSTITVLWKTVTPVVLILSIVNQLPAIIENPNLLLVYFGIGVELLTSILSSQQPGTGLGVVGSDISTTFSVVTPAAFILLIVTHLPTLIQNPSLLLAYFGIGVELVTSILSSQGSDTGLGEVGSLISTIFSVATPAAFILFIVTQLPSIVQNPSLLLASIGIVVELVTLILNSLQSDSGLGVIGSLISTIFSVVTPTVLILIIVNQLPAIIKNPSLLLVYVGIGIGLVTSILHSQPSALVGSLITSIFSVVTPSVILFFVVNQLPAIIKNPSLLLIYVGIGAGLVASIVNSQYSNSELDVVGSLTSTIFFAVTALWNTVPPVVLISFIVSQISAIIKNPPLLLVYVGIGLVAVILNSKVVIVNNCDESQLKLA